MFITALENLQAGLRAGGESVSGMFGSITGVSATFVALFALMVLPGTQGFYGLIIAILIAVQTKMLGGELDITTLEPIKGVGLLAVGLCAGVVLWRSAVNQGEASAAAVSLTSRRPEQFGRSLLMPALVETYAAVAVLASILFIGAIVGMQVAAPDAAAEAAKAASAAVSP